MTDLTRILHSIEEGSPKAAEELLPLVYEELRRLAGSKMAKEPGDHTLQATALVHEGWLKLSRQSRQHYQNRSQFFATAAETMRRILVDRARRRLSQKRGGHYQRTEVDWIALPESASDDLVIKVNEALNALEAEDRQKAEVVKLKFFAGLTSQEIASIMDINEKTVRRHWSFAKAWLYQSMSSSD